MKTTQFSSLFIEAKHEVPSPHHKVMIVMHGLGDCKENYLPFIGEINVTGLAYVLIDAPRAYPIGSSWYDLPPANPMIGVKESSDMVIKLIEELKAHGYQNEDIFLCGFSQGGCIALHTFFNYNQKLGGIVALSPRVFYSELNKSLSDQAKKTPLFMAHGEFDPVIPYTEVSEAQHLIREQGLDVSFYAYEMEHEIDPIEMKDLREWLNEYL